VQYRLQRHRLQQAMNGNPSVHPIKKASLQEAFSNVVAHSAQTYTPATTIVFLCKTVDQYIKAGAPEGKE
jgi:hypothetical protein